MESSSKISPSADIKDKSKAVQDDFSDLPPKPPLLVQPQTQAQTISNAVVAKLIFFMVMLAVVPFITYYYALEHWFPENAMYCGFAAFAAANLMVAGYITVALFEDERQEQIQPSKKTN